MLWKISFPDRTENVKVLKDMGREQAFTANVWQERVKLVHSLVAIKQIQPTQILPELWLDPDLHEVVLEQNTVVFTHKPKQPQTVSYWIYNLKLKAAILELNHKWVSEWVGYNVPPDTV